MQTKDVPIQFFQTFQRIESRTDPVANIRARSYQWRAPFDGCQNGFRVPVNRLAFGMIVDRDLDFVFLAESFHSVQSIGFRLGNYSADAPFFCELENFAALGFV